MAEKQFKQWIKWQDALTSLKENERPNPKDDAKVASCFYEVHNASEDRQQRSGGG